MDSSSSHQHHHHHHQQQQQHQQHQQHNWLNFSLSNHHLATDSSQLCLFEAFHQNPSRRDLSTVLNCTTTSPKLEDFLGGVSNNSNSNNNNNININGSSSTGAALSQLSSETTPAQSSVGVYDDSELKSIAASFLRGYTAGQEAQQKHDDLLVTNLPLPHPSDLPAPAPVKKPTETFGQRTSIYRGVTRHRWTGRYEAHLWDNTCRREGQSRKGRQVYLGGYDKEEKAARAYDLAALKYWGPTTTTNFPVANYEKELEEMKHMTRQEFVASLRRKSSGFSRGASIYRGVTRHHQHGRWQARIGRVAGNKDLYLGTFSTQEEAAEAYDIAAIKFRGLNAVTNFDISRYDVKSIASSNLPIGGSSTNNNNNKSKASNSSSESMSDHNNNNPVNPNPSQADDFSSTTTSTTTTTRSFGLPSVKQQQQQEDGHFWSSLGQYQCSGFNSGAKNNNPNTLFHSTNTASDNSNGYFSMVGGGGRGGYIEQQNMSTENGGGEVVVPLVTRIALSSNQSSSNSTTYDGTSYGNWIMHHSFQPAKQNLSVVYQTPIFGIE